MIEDIRFLHRHDVADAEVLEFFALEIEREVAVDRYVRIWVGTRGRDDRPGRVRSTRRYSLASSPQLPGACCFLWRMAAQPTRACDTMSLRVGLGESRSSSMRRPFIPTRAVS
jgi:hypothetical protein